MTQSFELGYSAPADLKLHVGGRTLSVAKVGPERIVLSQPMQVPAGEAELEITIGGKTKRQSIVIDTSGASVRGEISYR
jgi:hypothetical protein